MSSVSRLIRTASVIWFFPSCEAVGAVKFVESRTFGDYIKNQKDSFGNQPYDGAVIKTIIIAATPIRNSATPIICR